MKTKNKIKIYLQKPWRFSEDSPYYKHLLEHPPNGIEYINPKKFDFAQSKNKIKILNFAKQNLRKLIRKFSPSLPNTHHTKNAEKYDLIHCTRCLSKNKKPWVADIEFVGQFWISRPNEKYPYKEIVRNYLLSPYCKKILAWTEWTKKGILEQFPEIKEKVEVVYPAIPTQKFEKIKTGKTILLFVSRRFYFKGGLYAIEVMDRIIKKNKNVEGWIVSDTPEEVIKKYSKNKKIKFLGLKSQKELFEKIYPAADILIYPSFTDTFGFAILEAMSSGLPVISVEGHSRKDLIEDGKNGFVVKTGLGDIISMNMLITLSGKEKIINELCEKTSRIIKNKRLREKMSKECIKVIKEGKFSIRSRNNKIRKIYLEAMK